MIAKKKLLIMGGMLSAIVISVAASSPQQREEPKLMNIKVFPKNIPYRVLDHQMDVWAASLGVHCNFCHARNEQSGKMDFASDAKPEKTAARHMYEMMNKINKKFFNAQKDSLGMMAQSGINCNTCHHGTSHPEVKVPEEHHGPPPGAPGTPPPPPPGGNK